MFELNLLPDAGVLPVSVATMPFTNPVFPALGQDTGAAAPPPPQK